MTGIQALGVLAIRLWAAGMIFSAIAQLTLQITLFIQDLSGGSPKQFDAFYTSIFLIYIAVGFVAWVIAPRIAGLAMPSAKTASDISISMGSDQLIRIVGFLIGVYYMVEVGPEFIGHIVYAVTEKRAPDTYSAYDIGRRVTATSSFVIALFLMVRPNDLVRLFSSLRTAGLGPTE